LRGVTITQAWAILRGQGFCRQYERNYNPLVSRPRIKICGLTDASAARAAAAAGADAVGLVFAPSPRRLALEQARVIQASLPAFVEPVGVFANESAAWIRQVCEALALRTVQLHGEEDPSIADALAPRRVVRGASFGEDLPQRLAPWLERSNVAAALIDAPPPEGGAGPAGGRGRAFDYEALARLRAEGAVNDLPPLILAGGLRPENVAQAIATVGPDAVDVSSGVESARGRKDSDRIRRFCEAVSGEAET
jgi:phosphoribosylanthranilate isomerase